MIPILALALLAAPAPERGGSVTVDLRTWTELNGQIARLEVESSPPHAFALAKRQVSVRFARGVVSGELELEVDAPRGDVRVPVIGAAASLKEVTVDGVHAAAVQLPGAASYAVLIDKPGRHAVRVFFAFGREEERFARAFSLPLPPAPITRLSIDIPERDVAVDIEGGVILEERPTPEGTHLEGALDSKEALTVHWQRRLVHRRTEARDLEVESLALATVSEEMIRTKTELRFKVVSGEIDRVEIGVPSGLEVTRVSGDSVLQWTTSDRKLLVLLKHLFDDEVRMIVEAEAPSASASPDGSRVPFLEPKGAKLRAGYVAVEGRDGFEVRVLGASGGEEVGTREVPSRLAGLSDKPLLYAYRHQAAFPEIRLAIKRNQAIDLTQAIVDDLEASTVLVEQGLEITKLRFYVRNNTRQYLGLHLPEGALVTHALIDGTPFHPAAAKDPDGRERLLVPLRQSEKLSNAHPRTHQVKSDETLGEIALLYFGRTDRAKDIAAANPDVYGGSQIYVGQKLTIPASAGGVSFEESNSIVEIAYKHETERLSLAGSHRAALPDMDIPVMNVTWHYHFPTAYEPVRFRSNLKQLTAIRYDPLRRALQFFENALRIQGAWAGEAYGGSYKNILLSRKAIFQKEQQQQITEAFSSFPLVGDRYRFARVLLGDRPAELEISYMRRGLVPWVQWGALLLVLVLGARFMRSAQEHGMSRAIVREPFWSFSGALFVLLVAGHFVLGVNRHLLLGLDAALLVVLAARTLGSRRRSALNGTSAEPIDLARIWRASLVVKAALASIAIGLVLTYPLLLSTFALFVLVLLTAKKGRVEHA